MLAFDIETTGLDPATHLVTVVCTEDLMTGERRAYEFARVRATEPENEKLLRKDLVDAFDSASSLCAFNGVRFDIPFLYTSFKLDEQTCAGWLLKTSDILEAARLGIFGAAHTIALNLLCQQAAQFCILYSVICLRGNSVIRRTQKVIQGDDNGHVGRPCEVSLAPPCPEFFCELRGLCRHSYFGPRTCSRSERPMSSK